MEVCTGLSAALPLARASFLDDTRRRDNKAPRPAQERTAWARWNPSAARSLRRSRAFLTNPLLPPPPPQNDASCVEWYRLLWTALGALIGLIVAFVIFPEFDKVSRRSCFAS